MTTIANLPGIERLSPSDLTALVDAANWIGIDPDWLAAAMKFESGFNPAARNAMGSGATGLIQFMPSTAANLGTTTDALAAMTFQEQLEYVKKYFAGYRGKLKSLEDTYLAIFYPAFIGAALDSVLGSTGSAIYEQNRGFDREGKGYVTKSDITSTIRSVLASAKGRITVSGATAVAVGAEAAVSLGLAGAAGWAALRVSQGKRIWPWGKR